jgi:uncharacterized repeat protein (TIGR03803 family)
MRQKKWPISSPRVSAIVAIALLLTSHAWAGSKYKVLHAFTGGKDGGGLYGGLALDSHGNVYGTTSGGGTYGQGIVFKLAPGSNGKWSESVLHNFPSFADDGEGPTGGPVMDAAGNLYGTTEGDGGPYKYGTVFELSQSSNGWNETVLHRFGFNKYGCCPQASLVMNPAGNLFGTANAAFELSPIGHDWKETLLHDFTGQNGDGFGPYAGVILDAAGNVYGTTEAGGGSNKCGGGCGTVYQLSPTSDGKWKETILHRFQADWDGTYPGVGALILDSAGNLYGTADGGVTGYGVVFRLSPSSDGHWKETILYNFKGGANGIQPSAGVVMDKTGNLYGTTSAGGSSCSCGLIYKLAPGSNGKWTYTVLHRFTGADGAGPNANLILDSKGNLYGTTTTGGAGGYGVAFELTP